MQLRLLAAPCLLLLACTVTDARGDGTPTAAEQCRVALKSALSKIEKGSKRARLQPALQALAACTVLPKQLRTAAKEAAPLVAEPRAIRLHAALPKRCQPKSPFDDATTLTSSCVPPHVSKALLRAVDAPTCAFAEQTRQALAAAGALAGAGQRILDNLLLGAAAEREALQKR